MAVAIVALSIPSAAAVACSSPPEGQPTPCASDLECEGLSICELGRCVDPTAVDARADSTEIDVVDAVSDTPADTISDAIPVGPPSAIRGGVGLADTVSAGGLRLIGGLGGIGRACSGSLCVTGGLSR